MSAVTDPKAFGKVAVLMGGWSAERQVSLWSGEGIVTALRARGVDAHGVDVASPEQLFSLKAEGYVRVFNILHGTGGEDGTVQAILDLLGLPYPGSGVLASALAMDKLTTKRVWKAEGLPTPGFRVLESLADAHAAAKTFGYPFIIKPAADGSSVGVSKIKTAEQIDAAYALARGDSDRVVMAEQFIGRAGKNDEFTCPILLGRALPVIRIEPDGEFYDYHAKYISNDTRYHCPSGLDAGFEAEVQALCLKAFALAGCRHWGRVDFLIGEDGRPQLLELNTLPGMTSHSLVPMAAKAVGIDYAELCWRLLEATL
ncbi:D-alanine--D-alanine ligase [Stagnimonas aquatica]|uniref:D-alanine--D-alanine ligase n=1 Tax=Stagnimonas aquatica TaxID=2689987 RepID=A0A3N0VN57_9GAMM|nr:D-alanine--D-alanine ligase [Stagnimonas aquatica]ROH93418.1 D-alanine--D-alanine ligase [Stagnimonas aquatica]